MKVKPLTLKVNEHITLRMPEARDAKALFLCVQENKKHIGAWLPWAKDTKTVADSKKNIAKRRTKFEKGEGCDFCIFYDGELIGSIGYTNIGKANKYGTVGYWIAKKYEGQGIVSKALAKVIEFGKKQYKLHRIEIRMVVENERSKAVPRRLGFLFEGIQRESLYLNGKFRNMEIWSLISPKK